MTTPDKTEDRSERGPLAGCLSRKLNREWRQGQKSAPFPRFPVGAVVKQAKGSAGESFRNGDGPDRRSLTNTPRSLTPLRWKSEPDVNDDVHHDVGRSTVYRDSVVGPIQRVRSGILRDDRWGARGAETSEKARACPATTGFSLPADGTVC